VSHDRPPRSVKELVARYESGEREFTNVNLPGAQFLNPRTLKAPTLDGIRLKGGNLDYANLERVSLRGAQLSGTSLRSALLRYTNLEESDLDVDLWEAFVIGTHVKGSTIGANIYGATWAPVDFETATIKYVLVGGGSVFSTVLPFVNKILPRGAYEGGSFIADSALYWTLRQIDQSFTGNDRSSAIERVEDVLQRFRCDPDVVQKWNQMGGAAERWHSCFISYGEPDRRLAEQIKTHLDNRGIRNWVYAHDSTGGARLWEEIGKNRRKAGKVLVLCSSQSLVRDGLLKEVEAQIDEDPDKIIPLSCDALWLQAGFRVERSGRDLKPFLLERNRIELSDWQKFGGNYWIAIHKLLDSLKLKNGRLRRRPASPT